MGILDALPAIAAGAFGSIFRDATLSQAGPRTSDGRGGYVPGAPTSTPCKALVESYSDLRLAAGDIPASDRKVIVLAATLNGAVPSAGDGITVEGRGRTIVAVARDPAAATYELQAR